MKKLLLLLTLAFTININAQDDKTVTLVVSGQGKTQDEAKQVALRGAIEQAFGTFISSKTEILNDNLVKDEIVSVTNGNIQKFDVISEIQIPNGGYAITLKAIVSVSKLTNFCEGKGITVEFKGGLFADNIKMQELNEQNEIKAIKTLCQILKPLVDESFNYSLSTSEPKAIQEDPSKWNIDFTVEISANRNLDSIREYMRNILRDISMTSNEQATYTSINKKIYNIVVGDYNNLFAFRSIHSLAYLQDFCTYLHFAQADFIIQDGIKFHTPSDIGKLRTSDCSGDYETICWWRCSLCIFNTKNPILYSSNWHIIEKSDYIKNIPFPSFGDEYWRHTWTTYDNSKKIINSNYNYYKIQANSGNSDSEYAIKKLKLFADSSNVFISSSGSVAPYENNIYLKINLQPAINPFANLKMTIMYTTEELSKITAITVMPGKVEQVKFILDDNPEWINWFKLSLQKGSPRYLLINTLIENGFSEKSIYETEKRFNLK